MSMNNLSVTYWLLGRKTDALALADEALKRRLAKLGADHPDTLQSMTNLATLYLETSRIADALPLLEESLKRKRAALGPDHSNTLIAMSTLASAYADAARHADAVSLLREALERSKTTLGPDHPETLRLMVNLARCYLANRPAEAEPLARACLSIRAKKFPDDWRTFETQSVLGSSLLGTKKYAEAEPCLIKGYEGMKARESKIPIPSRNKLSHAGAQIVQLYDSWGQKDKAEWWRRKLYETELPTDPFSP
jgi:tetratricopeptide (TPR) repeat protein